MRVYRRVAPPGALLSEREITETTAEALSQAELGGARVLVVIPDDTRTAPVALFFRLLSGLLRYRVGRLDFLVALGTHQPMSAVALLGHVGVSREELETRFKGIGVLNHEWYAPGVLRTVGVIPAGEVRELSRGLLAEDVEVSINRRIFDYDHLILCGPVFPHEVAGFSGGNKYLFPGISGGRIVDVTHWLGALITCSEIIGTKHTPVRAMIDRARALIKVPVVGICCVVTGEGLCGLYIGPAEDAWSEAADLSSRVHIAYVPRAYPKVISVMPPMYKDLWTGAKGMYKLEPVVADGGELVIFAPHITEISYTHGTVIDRIGYHVRDYFLAQWERFRQEPWGVLAHSTHVRGAGTFIDGKEEARIRVTLATGIPAERCSRVNLGYRDPASVDLELRQSREAEGVLVVPKAGEILYRLKGQRHHDVLGDG